jgi:hypothetical protein
MWYLSKQKNLFEYPKILAKFFFTYFYKFIIKQEHLFFYLIRSERIVLCLYGTC